MGHDDGSWPTAVSIYKRGLKVYVAHLSVGDCGGEREVGRVRNVFFCLLIIWTPLFRVVSVNLELVRFQGGWGRSGLGPDVLEGG